MRKNIFPKINMQLNIFYIDHDNHEKIITITILVEYQLPDSKAEIKSLLISNRVLCKMNQPLNHRN